MDQMRESGESMRPPKSAPRLIERIAGDGGVDGAASGTEGRGHGDPKGRRSPIDLRPLPAVRSASMQDYREIVGRACEAFRTWRLVPAPKRGEIVRVTLRTPGEAGRS